MRIEKINDNKKQFLDLLLLADEQEDMIDKYLPDGDLFALLDISVMLTPCFGDIDPPCSKWFKEQRT